MRSRSLAASGTDQASEALDAAGTPVARRGRERLPRLSKPEPSLPPVITLGRRGDAGRSSPVRPTAHLGEFEQRLERDGLSSALVTTNDGRLVGVVIPAAAGG